MCIQVTPLAAVTNSNDNQTATDAQTDGRCGAYSNGNAAWHVESHSDDW